VVTEAEEGISYGMPAFRVAGKVVAGFAAFKHHLAYLPHSGNVLAELADDLVGYECTSGSFHFAIDEPLLLDDLSLSGAHRTDGAAEDRDPIGQGAGVEGRTPGQRNTPIEPQQARDLRRVAR
jgi:hypothetical protein